MVEGQSLLFPMSLTPHGQKNSLQQPGQTHLGCPTASLTSSFSFLSSPHPIWKLFLTTEGISLATNRAGVHSKTLREGMESPGWTGLGALQGLLALGTK